MKRIHELIEHLQGLDRRGRLIFWYATAAVLAVMLGWSFLAAKNTGLERKRQAREAVLREILPLKATYRSAKLLADQSLGKMASLRQDDTIGKIIDEIGIKGKNVKIAPMKGEERNGVMEEVADVRIEGLTANELVNLVFRLEKGARPVMLKKAAMKTRFDDPSRLDVALTVTLLKPLPGPAK